MSIQQAYDRWADSYDTNRTRDLEALSLRHAPDRSESAHIVYQRI